MLVPQLLTRGRRMDFSTERKVVPSRSMPKGGLVAALGIVGVIWALVVLFGALAAYLHLKDTVPNSGDVLAAFQEGGLEIGSTYPEDMTGSVVPKTYEEAHRFEIPSLGPDAGGLIYTFSSQEDLNAVENYYELISEWGVFGRPWIYTNGKVLVMVNGDLPEDQVLGYEDALNDVGMMEARGWSPSNP